jgi:hypothetical protein
MYSPPGIVKVVTRESGRMPTAQGATVLSPKASAVPAKPTDMTPNKPAPSPAAMASVPPARVIPIMLDVS